VMAELANKPPIPDGPSPHQQAKNDPTRRMVEAIRKLRVQLTAVNGDLAKEVSGWSREAKDYYLGEIGELKTVLIAIETTLGKETGNGKKTASAR
jgi:hypothetical protein